MFERLTPREREILLARYGIAVDAPDALDRLLATVRSEYQQVLEQRRAPRTPCSS